MGRYAENAFLARVLIPCGQGRIGGVFLLRLSVVREEKQGEEEREMKATCGGCEELF